MTFSIKVLVALVLDRVELREAVTAEVLLAVQPVGTAEILPLLELNSSLKR